MNGPLHGKPKVVMMTEGFLFSIYNFSHQSNCTMVRPAKVVTKLCVVESGHSGQRRPGIRFSEPVIAADTDRGAGHGQRQDRGQVRCCNKYQNITFLTN